jgi:membrane-bound serine protease (ClpP class)
MELVVVLLIVGAILLILETILPGLIAGIVGFLCLVGAVVTGYVEFGARTGNFILLGVIVGLVAGFSLWVKFFPDSRIARLFVSKRVVGNIDAQKPELLHQIGTAYTQLRPSGTALINGRRIDVVTEGALIERGTPVKVVAIEGVRVVVRAVTDQQSNVQEFKPIKT